MVFIFARFILPDEFNLALLTLELEFVKKGTKDEQVHSCPNSCNLLRLHPLHILVVVSYVSTTSCCFGSSKHFARVLVLCLGMNGCLVA